MYLVRVSFSLATDFCVQRNFMYASLKVYCVIPLTCKLFCVHRYCQLVCKEVGPAREKDLDFTKAKFPVAALYSAAK